MNLDNEMCNSAWVYQKKTSDMVRFLHEALFSPVVSTLEKALEKGYIHDFPGLMTRTLKMYPLASMATAKGHMDQERKNVQSNKLKERLKIKVEKKKEERRKEKEQKSETKAKEKNDETNETNSVSTEEEEIKEDNKKETKDKLIQIILSRRK